MNRKTMLTVGIITVFFAAVTPMPELLSVPGTISRAIIGVAGCALSLFGLLKAKKKAFCTK